MRIEQKKHLLFLKLGFAFSVEESLGGHSRFCSVCVTVPNYMRQIQIRFGRYQLGQNPNRALLFVRVKHWEIIADNLSKAGWSWGIVSAIDCEGRTIWIADAHRDDGKRFVVHADEKLTAFLELECAPRTRLRRLIRLARKNVISPSRCGHCSAPVTGEIVESFCYLPGRWP